MRPRGRRLVSASLHAAAPPVGRCDAAPNREEAVLGKRRLSERQPLARTLRDNGAPRGGNGDRKPPRRCPTRPTIRLRREITPGPRPRRRSSGPAPAYDRAAATPPRETADLSLTVSGHATILRRRLRRGACRVIRDDHRRKDRLSMGSLVADGEEVERARDTSLSPRRELARVSLRQPPPRKGTTAESCGGGTIQ